MIAIQPIFAEADGSFFSFVQAILAVFLSGIISGLLSLYVLQRQGKKDDQKLISERIDRLIGFALEYPYLEDDEFANGWPDRSLPDERYQRYDNYCCFLFNLLESLYKTHEGNRKKMYNELYFPELAHRHRKWWDSDPVNSRAYLKDFSKFVNTEIETYDRNTNGGQS